MDFKKIGWSERLTGERDVPLLNRLFEYIDGEPKNQNYWINADELLANPIKREYTKTQYTPQQGVLRPNPRIF